MGIRIGSACALVALAAAASSARANMLVNGGLELNPAYSIPLNPGFVTAGPVTNSTALPGWTVTTGTVDVVPSTYWQVKQGSYSVDLVGSPGTGSIRQLVSGTQNNTDYSMTFDWAPNPVVQGTDETLTKNFAYPSVQHGFGHDGGGDDRPAGLFSERWQPHEAEYAVCFRPL